MSEQNIHVILVAAGSGVRMGTRTPKQFLPLARKPVIQYSIDTFLTLNISSLKVVSQNEYKDNIDTLKGQFEFVEGGNTRQESVLNGLKALKNKNIDDQDIVLIHDAARPLIHAEDIQSLLQCLQTHDAACLVNDIADSVVHTGSNEKQDRSAIKALQTPQGYRVGTIWNAHQKAIENGIYDAGDDTELVIRLGQSIEWLSAQHPNFKITTQKDLKMAEALLSQTPIIRTGSGYDVHAFENTPTERKLILCGIAVPHERALAGHSDADVGLHAITDALLGAAGLGDIGDHFPPSDPAHKDRDSAEFLEITNQLLKDNGFRISNVDVTLICEEPKIGPHKGSMRARIAQILGIDEASINVKATTTEKLGFTGRKEGIAAQASATIIKHV